LVRFSDFLPHSGLALNLAFGNGRNSLFMAREGLAAFGVDRSRALLEAGREAVARANLHASFVEADLRRFGFPANALSVVVCFKSRNPELYPSIRAALRLCEVLIYETYTCQHALSGLKLLNPEHLLELSELDRAFYDWEIIFYREVSVVHGTASLAARKPLSAWQY
jgi:SAM-dependent methyltransferase